MGAPGNPPPSGGGAVGAKKDNCRGVESGKINIVLFAKNVFQSDRTLSRVCAMIKVSATRQGEKTSTIPAVAGVKKWARGRVSARL